MGILLFAKRDTYLEGEECKGQDRRVDQHESDYEILRVGPKAAKHKVNFGLTAATKRDRDLIFLPEDHLATTASFV